MHRFKAQAHSSKLVLMGYDMRQNFSLKIATANFIVLKKGNKRNDKRRK